jgi:outer membrane protein OmpA-like peptidoglycan-associated protein
MRPSPFFCRVLIFIYIFFSIDLSAIHYLKQPVDSVPNYVVIGAFAKQRNASRFVAHATKDLHLQARFEINPNRNLYYVYCLSTADLGQAISEAERLRSNTELQDAWVYRGFLGVGNESVGNVDIHPTTEEQVDVQASDKEVVQQDAPQETTVVTSADIQETSAVAPANTEVNEAVKAEVVKEKDDNVVGKRFVFQLQRMSNKEMVKGEVDVIDPDKLRKIGSFEGNKSVKVPEIKNKSGKVALVAQVFGYRKLQHDLDYNNPIVDSIGVKQDADGNIVVPFELVRLKQGDFAIMYNVFYFRDAAIMRPESQFEVNNLVEMMKENPNCIIRLHGHTNGNHAGKIIYWGEGATDLFSLNGSRNGYGSAKELSHARAAAIQAYLISQGIDASRCSVKAWGGKKAIHDKLSARAQENVRVEIEIVKDH